MQQSMHARASAAFCVRRACAAVHRSAAAAAVLALVSRLAAQQDHRTHWQSAPLAHTTERPNPSCRRRRPVLPSPLTTASSVTISLCLLLGLVLPFRTSRSFVTPAAAPSRPLIISEPAHACLPHCTPSEQRWNVDRLPRGPRSARALLRCMFPPSAAGSEGFTLVRLADCAFECTSAVVLDLRKPQGSYSLDLAVAYDRSSR